MVGGGNVGASVGGMTEVGVGAEVFVGWGRAVLVGCAGGGVLVGFGRPPLPLVAVGVKKGTNVPGVEVAVAEGVNVAAGVGVTGSSMQEPGPIIPRL